MSHTMNKLLLSIIMDLGSKVYRCFCINSGCISVLLDHRPTGSKGCLMTRKLAENNRRWQTSPWKAFGRQTKAKWAQIQDYASPGEFAIIRIRFHFNNVNFVRLITVKRAHTTPLHSQNSDSRKWINKKHIQFTGLEWCFLLTKKMSQNARNSSGVRCYLCYITLWESPVFERVSEELSYSNCLKRR